MTSRPALKPTLLLAASGLALTLAGCKIDNRPLLSRDNPQYEASALQQPGLPGEPPYAAASYGGPSYDGGAYRASYLPPERAYPYAERAYRYDRAFYDSPPDYEFAYGDEEPWVWEAADDSLMFAEPYGGDYRFYYYEPGAAYPYFVRDDRYGYAYGDNGVLVALFDAAGALISGSDYGRYAPQARQYWSRGYDLHTSYGRGQRAPVDLGAWQERAPRISRAEQSWISAPERQPQWRSWRASAGAAALQRFDVKPRPNRAFAAEGRADNGLHRGWDKQAMRADAGPMPGPRFDHPRGRGPAFAREEQRFAPSADRHGRDAAFRGPEARSPQFAPQEHPAFQPHGGGEGHGGHGGDGGQHFATAQPPPGPQGQWQDRGHGHHEGWHGGGAPPVGPQPQQQPPQHAENGGGWHGGGGHDQHGQPQQPQPQAQGQQGGGQGHGGGEGGGHGHGNGGGDDHGKHHG